MERKVSSLAERPDDRRGASSCTTSWPEFVSQGPGGRPPAYGRIAKEFPAYVLFAEDEQATRSSPPGSSRALRPRCRGPRRAHPPGAGTKIAACGRFADLRRGVPARHRQRDRHQRPARRPRSRACPGGPCCRRCATARLRQNYSGFSEVVAPHPPQRQAPRTAHSIEEYAHRLYPRRAPALTPGCASAPGPAPPSTPCRRPPR